MFEATHKSFKITFVTGSPGSGKSYSLTRDVLRRLATFSGKVYTNLPLNVQEIGEHVAQHCDKTPEEIEAQIVLLPRSVLANWQDGTAGPWDLAGDANGNELIIDECHLFCKKRAAKLRNERWEKWLGEVRHEGWRRMMFVTQDDSKVGMPIKSHAELRYELTNAESLRDPFLKIPLSYWYEVIASFTGNYTAGTAITEYRRKKGKLVEEHRVNISLEPYYFKFYNSYEAAGGGAGKQQTATKELREFEKRPTLVPQKNPDGKMIFPTWIWFLNLFKYRFGLAVGAVVFAYWMCFAGGFSYALGKYLDMNQSMVYGTTPEYEEQLSEAIEISERNAPRPIEETPEELTRQRAIDIGEALAAIDNEETKAAIVAELQMLNEQFQEQQEELARAEQRFEAAKAEERIVAMDWERIWLTGGQVYRKGDVIREGPYEGTKVEAILWPSRMARFENGDVLRLASPASRVSDAEQVQQRSPQEPPTATGNASQVQRSLQPVVTEDTNRTGTESNRGADNDLSRGSTTRPVPPGNR